MKWLNKKNSRKGWIQVSTYDLNKWRLEEIVLSMKRGDAFITVEYLKGWCRKYESDGKFFYSWQTGFWYFEKESDAIIFTLKWT